MDKDIGGMKKSGMKRIGDRMTDSGDQRPCRIGDWNIEIKKWSRDELPPFRKIDVIKKWVFEQVSGVVPKKKGKANG